MSKRIGILTSGGDCPGLNAVIRGVAKPLIEQYGMRVFGILEGYKGLMEGNAKELTSKDLSGILTLGGTILGTSRRPFKQISKSEEMIESMIKTYHDLELDCLITLGGNGTHKTANLLSERGLNVIGLPKTIDNDLYGTDVTFGFQTAVDIATEVVDRIHTTAHSHGRVMIIELMGHKAGWLTLYAGMAGGADVILIPELPYSIDRVIDKLYERKAEGKNFSIVCVAEGAISLEESMMSKKEFKKARKEMPFSSVGYRIASEITEGSEFETRVTVPGYQQRGGGPCPYDRTLSTKFGTYAAKLILEEQFGRMISLKGNEITSVPLSKIAGKLKLVPEDEELIKSGRMIGVSFGQPK
jgi:6-phosphofructokinase 1